MSEDGNQRETRAILLCGIGGVGKTTTANFLHREITGREPRPAIIAFDKLRKDLAPKGADPFSQDRVVKAHIYREAARYFSERISQGDFLVIDSGMSVESIRINLKVVVPGIKIVHLDCPKWAAVLRDTRRSLTHGEHERGRFLHLRAIFDLLNPLKRHKFPQPGITYPFEYPECADLHVWTFLRHPRDVAREILSGLLADNKGLGQPLHTEPLVRVRTAGS